MENIAGILAALRQERDRIDAAIGALVALNEQSESSAGSRVKAAAFNPRGLHAPRKRIVSKQSRARMAAAQRARRERERKAAGVK
jgi:hypothetical protein